MKYAAAILLCLAVPALAQPARPPKSSSLEARVEALEKDNAALRADVEKLQRQLYGTRAGLSVSSSLAQAAMPPTIQPQTVQQQQAQTDAIIRQQNMATQMNSLQLQQNMMMDRQREQYLSTPQPYGALPPATAPFAPIAPLPPPP